MKSENAEKFDKKLAMECAQAYAASTALGCTLSDRDGRVFAEYGRGCGSCRICAEAGLPQENCIQAHIYGMTEAERFGGRYTYFCPMGLTCFVSPILGDGGAQAKITVGPFLMVERADFVACELEDRLGLPLHAREKVEAILEEIPFVPPRKVDQLARLLFMAVGFMNKVSSENLMLEAGQSDEQQGQITSYILELKKGETAPRYPFEKERALLQCVARQNKPQAQSLLNELLGGILFAEGGNLELVKSRLYELLVLVSRTAIENGADGEQILNQIHQYRRQIEGYQTIDTLCFWLSAVVNQFMDSLFAFPSAKHANVIHRCIQYIGTHYKEHITLEEMARNVYLSPPYLSKIFRQETGMTFNAYVNRVRVNRAKELLRDRRLSVMDVAYWVGYEDQSYFTKVFKRSTGVLPKEYRDRLQQMQEALKSNPEDFERH